VINPIVDIVPTTEEKNGVVRIRAEEEAPMFDFDNISWADEKEKSLAMSALENAKKAGDVEALTTAFGRLELYLSKCLVSVPREWLVKSAPEVINWSEQASFKYIKGMKFANLLQALNQAQVEAQKK
jgi:hypothetical protein